MQGIQGGICPFVGPSTLSCADVRRTVRARASATGVTAASTLVTPSSLIGLGRSVLVTNAPDWRARTERTACASTCPNVLRKVAPGSRSEMRYPVD